MEITVDKIKKILEICMDTNETGIKFKATKTAMKDVCLYKDFDDDLYHFAVL